MPQHKIGITVQFSDYGKHLETLFQNIDMQKYTWYVTNSEIYCAINNDTVLNILQPGIYDGKSFLTEIETGTYHIIHLRLFAVPHNVSINPGKILTYQDFLSSSAEIALLCADCQADIYVKDEASIESLAEAASQKISKQELFLTPENNGRTGFWI